MSDALFSRLRALGQDEAASPTADFDLNDGFKRPANLKLRAAGVLVPLVEGPDGVQIILTKRSSALKHHPGQIAFPGGKVDPDDGGAVAAALREAEEEIGLPRTAVEVLGTLPAHETGTGYSMVPVLGRITADFAERAEPGEVDEIFRVPFAHVTDLSRYIVTGRHFRGVQRQYFTVPYGPYYIWGATARILHALAERLAGDARA